MMTNRKLIRTYQRKSKKTLINVSLAPPVILTGKYNSVKHDHFNNDGTCNDSMDHDPFETTFDRIAKEAV